MPIPFTRASRLFDPVAGVGGHMLVAGFHPTSGQQRPASLFDVGQWAIKQTFRNKNVTHSGSNGADLYTRVGAGWTFAAQLNFPSNVENSPRFAEEIVGSLQGHAVTFAIGEPRWWWNRGMGALSYQANKFLADIIDTVCASDGESVVTYNIIGVGSSLLGTYQSPLEVLPGSSQDTLLTPQLWF